MAIFGRNTARQRLRRAAEQSLSIPAFKAPPIDAAPWVTGGLWPAELSTMTAETAPLVRYLKADLHKIVTAANEELKKIRCAGLVESERLAHEARVINEARSFAVRRVESSVRQLRDMTRKSTPLEQPVIGTAEPEIAPRFHLAPPPPDIPDTPESLTATTNFTVLDDADGGQRVDDAVDPEPAPEQPDAGDIAANRSSEDTATADQFDADATTEFAAQSPPEHATATEPAATEVQGYSAAWEFDETAQFASPSSPDNDILAEPAAPDAQRHSASPDFGETTDIDAPPRSEPAVTFEPPTRASGRDTVHESRSPLAPDDTQALEEIANLMQEFSVTLDLPLEPPPPAAAAQPPQPTLAPPIPAAAANPEPLRVIEPARRTLPPPPAETEAERLRRLVLFVARQQPDLCWAVGVRHDGSTLLVTDLAHGWIPPGITLPAGVRLVEPGRRHGAVDALLGATELSAAYAPGDPLGWSADDDITATSPQPRALPAIADLGWVLSDATHWREGLPRMVSTLAKAAARGTGVLGAERDVLRAYLDTARYQLFAGYPDVESALLLNCLLLAAAEALAGNDLLGANYHLAWFEKLNAPSAE